jgi:hypothetical protein
MGGDLGDECYLVLRPHLPSAAAAVVAAHGAGLVEATPTGPVQHRLWWRQAADHQPIDQPPDLGHGQRNQLAVFGQFRQERPPLSAAPGTRDRTTAR